VGLFTVSFFGIGLVACFAGAGSIGFGYGGCVIGTHVTEGVGFI